MAKFSDLFGRKGLVGTDKLTGRNGNGGDPISIETCPMSARAWARKMRFCATS